MTDRKRFLIIRLWVGKLWVMRCELRGVGYEVMRCELWVKGYE